MTLKFFADIDGPHQHGNHNQNNHQKYYRIRRRCRVLKQHAYGSSRRRLKRFVRQTWPGRLRNPHHQADYEDCADSDTRPAERNNDVEQDLHALAPASRAASSTALSIRIIELNMGTTMKRV